MISNKNILSGLILGAAAAVVVSMLMGKKNSVSVLIDEGKDMLNKLCDTISEAKGSLGKSVSDIADQAKSLKH